MKKFLVTLPDYGYVTACLSHYARKLIEIAKGKAGITVLELPKERANANTVASYLTTHRPRLVMFNGHGNGNSILGQNGEPLISYGENEELLSGAIVYAVACKSSKLLGDSCTNAGVDAFIGYAEDFALLHNPQQETRPLDDSLVKSFFEPSNIVITSLLKGNTVAEAYNKSQRAFQEEINKHALNQNSPESAAVLPLLKWDMNIQRLYGIPESTF